MNQIAKYLDTQVTGFFESYRVREQTHTENALSGPLQWSVATAYI